MSRKPLIAGNWKLNHLTGPAVETAAALKGMVAGVTGTEIVICPVFTVLDAVGTAIAGSNIALGGQNCYTKESGAFTGEISPQMLADVGCTWVIIGHSERRQYFGETDALLNEKAKFARASGLKVMFCIGETLEERNGGQMNAVLERQVSKGLEGLSDADFDGLAIAYEPVWAIGTGVVASPEQAQEAHAFVRGLVKKQFSAAIADAVRIQYGGSVKPDNAKELMGKPDVDGFLVGGAALKADSFAAIVKNAL
ncbi:MAG: triose-phosphate isomerase [Candidatus Hydrogenedentes bacterium]|nr:triose-phosphate isomerase [Candidatus Hydrogenedentota bacterium]